MKRNIPIFHQSSSGFSLVELMVALAIFGILMTMVFSSFIPVAENNSRQGRISETKLETGIGLDLLRADLEHAGFGLPWSFGGTPNPYNEPLAATAPIAMNDAPDVPRALSSEDATNFGLNNNNGNLNSNSADYLSIKAINVTRGVASQKWGWLWRNVAHSATMQSMSRELFAGGDQVIVIRPRGNRQLIVDGAGANNFSATMPAAPLDPFNPPNNHYAALTNFSPDETSFDPNGERYLVYGLDDIANPQRPFNRTDYYIRNTNVPDHCSPGTGVLTKATLNQNNNQFIFLPIVDCVADFQVVYYLDTSNPIDGGWDTRANADGLIGMTAEEIRNRVKAIHCYILTHEGGIDRTYLYPNATVYVGEVAADGTTPVGDPNQLFTLNGNAALGPTWANYRWKVYSLSVTPKNLQ